jgi:hypothetical protein
LQAAGAKLAAFFRPGHEHQELEDGVPATVCPATPRGDIFAMVPVLTDIRVLISYVH